MKIVIKEEHRNRAALVSLALAVVLARACIDEFNVRDYNLGVCYGAAALLMVVLGMRL